MWSEKYRPSGLDEMVGNEEARAKVAAWLKKWKKGAKAIVLVGPPGTGKTTTVVLTAKKNGMQLVELNASDTRTKDKLSKKIGEVLGSTSLFGEKTLVFLDEVDGLAGRSDYGAVDYIKDAVKRSDNPVIMAANDPDSDEVRKLSSVATRVEFSRPAPGEVIAHLRKIAEQEGTKASEQELAEYAAAADGDIRSAINMLQSGTSGSKDRGASVKEAMDGFFGAMTEKEALAALKSYPGQPREKLRDLFNSINKSKIHPERKAAALEVLSRADVLMGRIMAGQDWRLLRYLDALLASDLWKALGDGGAKYSQEGAPWLLQLRIWNDSKKLKDIGSRAGKRLGISQRGFLAEDMPYFLILCGSKEFREEAVKSLDLEENYEAFIVKEAGRAGRR